MTHDTIANIIVNKVQESCSFLDKRVAAINFELSVEVGQLTYFAVLFINCLCVEIIEFIHLDMGTLTSLCHQVAS